MYKFKEIKNILLALILSLFVFQARAQNYDLSQFKDFEQLAKVNPAFTGVLQKLRLLAANKGSDLNIAFETKLFKSDNYLGGGFNQLSQSNVRRQTFYASYNRDKKMKNEAILKIAVQGDYIQKSFFKESNATLPFSFKDFNGKIVNYDSSNMNNFSGQRNYADLGFGLAYQGKRILIGANARHLNRPKFSVDNSSDDKMPIEANMQLSSYFTFGKTTFIPTGMLSVQGKDNYFQVGTGINYLDYTFIGQYEMLNDLPLLNMGLTYRKDRIFAAVTYAADLKNDDGIDLSNIKISLNLNLRKMKLENKGMLKYLSYLY
jgi:hypothetical protein